MCGATRRKRARIATERWLQCTSRVDRGLPSDRSSFREAENQRRHLRSTGLELDAHVLLQVGDAGDARCLREAVSLVEGERRLVRGDVHQDVGGPGIEASVELAEQ